MISETNNAKKNETWIRKMDELLAVKDGVSGVVNIRKAGGLAARHGGGHNYWWTLVACKDQEEIQEWQVHINPELLKDANRREVSWDSIGIPLKYKLQSRFIKTEDVVVTKYGFDKSGKVRLI
jgi:hypothetical protein